MKIRKFILSYKRESIRNFDLTPPPDNNTLAEISDYLQNLKPMYNEIKTELKIISSRTLKEGL